MSLKLRFFIMVLMFSALLFGFLHLAANDAITEARHSICIQAQEQGEV